MSIEKTTVQHRKLVVKAGMTAEDVKKSKDAIYIDTSYLTIEQVCEKVVSVMGKDFA